MLIRLMPLDPRRQSFVSVGLFVLFTASAASGDVVTAQYDATDATANLRAAILEAGPGGTVIVPPAEGTWFVSDDLGGGIKTGVLLDQPGQTFQISDGVEIRARRGRFRDSFSTLFRIAADGVVVQGAGPAGSILAMNKDDYTGGDYVPSQYRHAIEVAGYRDIVIRDLTINTAGGDGINLGGYFSSNPVIENLSIDNVSIWRAHRNGISVSSVRDSVISNVGVWETEGVDPEAAIDVELDQTFQRVQNVLVRDSIFFDSARRNLQFELFNYHNNSLDTEFGQSEGTPTGWVSISFERCQFIKSGRSNIYFGGPSGEAIDLPKNVPDWCWVNLTDCTVTDSGYEAVEFAHHYADTGMQLWFDGLLIENPGKIRDQSPAIAFRFGKSNYEMGDIGFYSGSRIVDDRDADVAFAPDWVRASGFKNIAGVLAVRTSAPSLRLRLGDNLRNVTLSAFRD